MTPLGVLLLLLYIGGVFVLPPAVGARAARSRDARMALLIVCALLIGIGIVVLVERSNLSRLLDGERFELPANSIGKNSITVWSKAGARSLEGNLVLKEPLRSAPTFPLSQMKEFHWELVCTADPAKPLLPPTVPVSYTVFSGAVFQGQPAVLHYQVNETTKPLLETLLLEVHVYSHDWEDLMTAQWLFPIFAVTLFVGAMLGLGAWWAVAARGSPDPVKNPAPRGL